MGTAWLPVGAIAPDRYQDLDSRDQGATYLHAGSDMFNDHGVHEGEGSAHDEVGGDRIVEGRGVREEIGDVVKH